jgi:translation initiation factor 3 subunit B
LDKKSLKIEGRVEDVQWSPGQNILSYSVGERDNTPARVALIEVPSRKMVREKHFYNVQDIKMHWQSEGDYLCVKVARKKNRKEQTTNFEIFCMRDKEIPVEAKELSDTIVAFAWEPKGSRFGIIHGDGQRPNVSFFQMKRGKLKPLGTFDARGANCLFWSPRGGYCLLAGLGAPLNGALEFVDVAMNESLATTDHFMCTDVEWDPSGRFVITSVLQPIGAASWKYTSESGYKLWTMQGILLATVPIEGLHQVLFRPRPASLITKEKEKEILKTLKDKYWSQFASEDSKMQEHTRKGAREERQLMRSTWRKYRTDREAEYEAEAEERAHLRGFESDDEEDYVTVERDVEELLSVEETVASS